MKKHLSKIRIHILAHKIISAIILIAILATGYWVYKKFTSTAGDIRYITAKVQKGSVIVSISGSGQVSSLNQVDIKTKASGDVSYINTKDGQKVAAGALIAKLDDKEAQKSVRDAEVNLESAKISLEKLKIEKSKENLDADLAQSYDDGFNTVANVFLDLPGIMTGIDDLFFKSTINLNQSNIEWYVGKAHSEDSGKAIFYKEKFLDSYDLALKAYENNFENYKSTSRTSDSLIIEKLILETYNTIKLIADAIKDGNNYIDFVNDSMQTHNLSVPAIIATHKTILSGYTAKTNSPLISLLSAKTDIKSYKDSFLNADLDIQSSMLSVKQKQNSLQDAKEKLEDYFIRAPFEGSITKINIKKGDTVGSGIVVTTVITKNQLAEISLNEVDAAKIKVQQKAALTFDAIPDLTISGVVADIDAVGTVSQGVVTYIVKVSFDSQDARVKPGMSVSATVVTDSKQDVLLVPNSAVKSLPDRQAGQAGKNYVEVLKTDLIKIPVEVGLANDSQSEIISGLEEGDEIIVRTISPTTAATTAAPSIFGNTGGNRRR